MNLALLALLLGCRAGARSTAAPRSQAPAGFWDAWGDGKAEVSGYRLAQPRYGELRRGEAVLIFVTETFTHGQRVKSDGGHPDEYPVMKLGAVRDFQTGIYDYNAMTTAFVPLSGELPLGLAEKVSFSLQEWCGHAYAELHAERKPGRAPTDLRLWGRSYFDGEAAEERTLGLPADAVVADAIPVLARGLAGEWLHPGQTREISLLPPLLEARLQHEPLEWVEATAARSAGTESVTVPAGTFDAYSVAVTPAAGGAWTGWFEAAPPHRLVRWTGPDGEEGALTGSMRTAYWEQNGEGGEALRAQLGLPAHPWP